MEEQKQNQELLERREFRRRRRRKNQILAGIAMTFIILILAGIVVAAGSMLLQHQRQQQEMEESLQQSMIEDMLTEETDMELPPPSQEPEPVEKTPEEKLDEIINAGIQVMPIEDKVAGLFFVTPEAITGVSTATAAGDGTKNALMKYAVGGLVYFGKNLVDKDQIHLMLENTKLYSRYPIFLGIDEEGGSVSRLTEKHIIEGYSGAKEIGQTNDPQNAYQSGAVLGTILAELGFNVDFAPVADIANVEGSVMENRAYGASREQVSPYVIGMMEGLSSHGVEACVKHFPGHGSTTRDTHQGLAVSDRTREQFYAEELGVYQDAIAAGASMIMVGHISAESLTGNLEPCIFSEVLLTDILRKEMNYDGIIITDALNMKAISDYYGADEAAIKALRAGCDMLLMPEDFEKAYNGVLQAVADGTISEERIDDALRRIYRVKYKAQLEQIRANN